MDVPPLSLVCAADWNWCRRAWPLSVGCQ